MHRSTHKHMNVLATNALNLIQNWEKKIFFILPKPSTSAPHLVLNKTLI
jgi:hypothetical protein